eukprot:3476360-Rhodomonas_salina.1
MMRDTAYIAVTTIHNSVLFTVFDVRISSMSAPLVRGKVVAQESKQYLGDTTRLCNLNRLNGSSWPERGHMLLIPWSESDPETY